ncbi:hypothetical protein [Novosphingobium sp. BL-52-GroH]|uniref:hypothetical protein n=1 Tax=Novosphingobium sp. BL-52-GroH TaxID=3349877 RepID=UPI0038501EC7
MAAIAATISLTVDLEAGSPVGAPDTVANTDYQLRLEHRTAELESADPALLQILERRLQGSQKSIDVPA